MVHQLALWLSWQSACLVNRRSWVRIPVGPFVPFSKCQGIARTQSPTNKNYAPELPTFGAIDGVSPTGVQWKGLVHGEPPCGSRYPLCQVSMLCQRPRGSVSPASPGDGAGGYGVRQSSRANGHICPVSPASRRRGACRPDPVSPVRYSEAK